MRFPAHLYPCILGMLSLVHAVPVHQNSPKIFKMQADTIINRIKDHIKGLEINARIVIGDSELYPEVPADKPIQGLGSIVDIITTFQKILQRLPSGHVSQIHNDLSSLLSNLKHRMTSMRCTLKAPTNDRPLDAFLKDIATHHVTFGYLVLDRLKQFMQKLTDNLDHLKSC